MLRDFVGVEGSHVIFYIGNSYRYHSLERASKVLGTSESSTFGVSNNICTLLLGCPRELVNK